MKGLHFIFKRGARKIRAKVRRVKLFAKRATRGGNE